MLSQVQGEILHSICRLKGDAERLAKAMGRMADIDPHAVERGMIALRRAASQLEKAATGYADQPPTHQYTVYVPGRCAPYLIEAESYSGLGDSGARFFKGEDVVASLAETSLIAKSGSLSEVAALVPGSPLVQLGEPARLSASVELVAGEALLVGCPLTDAIERTASMMGDAKGEVGEVLSSHLHALLAEQRGQLFRVPVPSRDVIGTV